MSDYESDLTILWTALKRTGVPYACRSYDTPEVAKVLHDRFWRGDFQALRAAVAEVVIVGDCYFCFSISGRLLAVSQPDREPQLPTKG